MYNQEADAAISEILDNYKPHALMTDARGLCWVVPLFTDTGVNRAHVRAEHVVARMQECAPFADLYEKDVKRWLAEMTERMRSK